MRVKNKLADLEFRPSKSRGQNFIIDPSVTEKILSFAQPRAEEAFVEIGPGLGALTEQLLQFPNLTVVEIEPKLCADLQRRFPKLKVINADVRNVDFGTIGKELCVFGNLPYSFSTDILFHLIDQRAALRRAVLLLQKEFVERMAADPGGRDYGVLSVSCQMWADVIAGPLIPGTAFHPPTKVNSRVVELHFRREPKVQVPDEQWMKKVVKACFFRRRKKLDNSIAASGMFSHEQIAIALAAAGIDAGRRAETLSIQEFATLAQCFSR